MQQPTGLQASPLTRNASGVARRFDIGDSAGNQEPMTPTKKSSSSDRDTFGTPAEYNDDDLVTYHAQLDAMQRELSDVRLDRDRLTNEFNILKAAWDVQMRNANTGKVLYPDGITITTDANAASSPGVGAAPVPSATPLGLSSATLSGTGAGHQGPTAFAPSPTPVAPEPVEPLAQAKNLLEAAMNHFKPNVELSTFEEEVKQASGECNELKYLVNQLELCESRISTTEEELLSGRARLAERQQVPPLLAEEAVTTHEVSRRLEELCFETLERNIEINSETGSLRELLAAKNKEYEESVANTEGLELNHSVLQRYSASLGEEMIQAKSVKYLEMRLIELFS